MIYFVNHTFNIYYAFDFNIMLFKYHDTIVNWNRIFEREFWNLILLISIVFVTCYYYINAYIYIYIIYLMLCYECLKLCVSFS